MEQKLIKTDNGYTSIWHKIASDLVKFEEQVANTNPDNLDVDDPEEYHLSN